MHRLTGRLLARRFSTRLNASYVEGPLEPPLSHLTLPAYFAQNILPRHAERPGLICRAEKPRAHGGPTSRHGNMGVQRHLAWTFAEMDEHVLALARGLIAMGVKKGDRVGVIMGNNSAYVMLQWACARIGAILVTLNPAYRVHELIATLSLAQVNHLFVVPRIRSSAYLDLLASALPSLQSSTPGALRIDELPDLRNIIVVDDLGGGKEWEEVLSKAKCAVDFREILVWRADGREQNEVTSLEASSNEHEVINLQFTSGTTGAPKAVSLTHHNLLNNGIQIGRCMNLDSTDVLCNVPPLFHCFGLVLGNLAAWTHGSCIVYASPIFSPPAIVDTLLEERCSALHGVPTHFMGVLAEIEKREKESGLMVFERLRTGIAAGSSIPIPLMKTLVEKLNLTELTIAYGMTETSPVSFQTTPADPLIKRVETVGKIHPHVKAKIISTDRKHAVDEMHAGEHEEQIVPVGEPGELCVAGYLLQAGYWRDPEQTAQVMRRDASGTLWMHTGDEAILDADGYLRIVGRIKDIIIRGGENLFPVQIENVLMAHEAVREAAAVAVPDARYGEVVGAWVVREPGRAELTAEEVRKAVAGGMNPQNAPAYVWFVGEDYRDPAAGGEVPVEAEEDGGVRKFAELPKTASGKVMKHVLRRWSRELAQRGVGKVGA